MEMKTLCYLGIDFGTSGCRGTLIDAQGQILAEQALPLPGSECDGVRTEQHPQAWWDALQTLIPALLQANPHHCLCSIALDGTSGSILLADLEGHPLGPALMYDDRRATVEANELAVIAPLDSAAHGAGSGLSKLLWLLRHQCPTQAFRVHTQADWLSGMLSGGFGLCDSNNALKLGYDARRQEWPAWLVKRLPPKVLPQVVPPATPLGKIRPVLAKHWGLSTDIQIVSGTTDSTAAVLATGISKSGEAVTSLGSTLVMKVLCEHPISAPKFGVYSQPYGSRWLVGGGSNSGGAVLRHFFSDEQMTTMTPLLDPEHPTGLDYIPLLHPGERFPHCDPHLAPLLTPRPADDVQFFQGMLESMARIEYEAYQRLADLGAPWPTRVMSIGGGANNPAWCQIRQALLKTHVCVAKHQQAAYGTALLARQALQPAN